MDDDNTQIDNTEMIDYHTEHKPKKNGKKWSLKKKLIVILGSVLTGIILLVAIANMATSAPLSASDTFISNIKALNAEKAYAQMSTEAKDTVTAEEFEYIIDQIGPILTGTPEVESKEVSAESGTDSKATIIYNIKGSDGITYKFTTMLINQGGEWKVQAFDSDDPNN